MDYRFEMTLTNHDNTIGRFTAFTFRTAKIRNENLRIRAGVVPGSETCFLFADLKFLFDTYVLPRSIHALFPSKAPGC